MKKENLIAFAWMVGAVVVGTLAVQYGIPAITGKIGLGVGKKTASVTVTAEEKK